MTIDDNYREALRRSAELLVSGDKAETLLRVSAIGGPSLPALPAGVYRLAINPDGSLTVIQQEAGAPKFDLTFRGSTTPGISQSLITHTVPAGKEFRLTQAVLNCPYEGEFDVFDGAALIGSGRTGAGRSETSFRWYPFYPATAGAVISIAFRQGGFRPVTQVDAFLQGTVL